MNIKEIKEIIKLMNENGLTEFELEREGLRVRLRKAEKAPEGFEKLFGTSPAATLGLPKTGEVAPRKKEVEIKAPMVGTFYRAPSPDAPPFVDVETKIEPGQVVCIVEAMKLMNEIKSEIKGKVTEILVENGDAVEFGTVLFLVEPT